RHGGGEALRKTPSQPVPPAPSVPGPLPEVTIPAHPSGNASHTRLARHDDRPQPETRKSQTPNPPGGPRVTAQGETASALLDIMFIIKQPRKRPRPPQSTRSYD